MNNHTSHPRPTPGQHRANLRAKVKRVMLAASDACDVTFRGVFAVTLGITRQRVDQMFGLDDDAQISVADACALPEPIRRALAAELIGEGAFIAELPLSDASSTDLALIAKTQRHTARAVCTALEGLADGHITAAEGADLERDCNAAIASLLTTRELGRRAQRERVVPLRVAK